MANNIIGSLRVVLGLDSARFERGARRTKGTVRDMRRQFLAVTAAATAFAGGLALVARRSAETIDRQSKLAQSLNTTTGSVQVLERAADLAGVKLGEAGDGAARLTRRISLAAQGTGPAVKAFERLGLNLDELARDDLITRISKVQKAIEDTIPATERAGVLSQVFGDRAFVAFQRLDPAVLQEATRELEKFGVIVSDVDADQIEKTNDALSRLRLIAVGFGNQLAVAVAPALEKFAAALGEFFAVTGPGGRALRLLGQELGRLTSIAIAAVTVFGVRYVGAVALAAAGTVSFAGALRLLRVALIRTGVGALIVGLGEVIYQFTKVVAATGSVGEALNLLANIAKGAWEVIKSSAASIVPSLRAVFKDVEAAFLGMIQTLVLKWNEFLTTIIVGLPPDTPQAIVGPLTAAARAASEVFGELQTSIGSTRGAAGELRAEAEALRTQGFGQLYFAIQQLRDVLAESEEQTDETSDAVERLQEALDGVDIAAGNAGSAVENELKPALEGTNDTLERLADDAAGAFSSIVRGAESAREAVGRLLDRLADNLLTTGFNALGSAFGIPGFATGTNYFKGGLTWVGERGPELVSLPKGTKVMDAGRSADFAAESGGSTVNISIDARGAQEGVAAQIDAALARRLPEIQKAAVASVASARRRGVPV